jgi:CubicO group peptidase (beta-lactamase class C family)
MTNEPTRQVTELLQELAADAGEGAQPGLQVAAYMRGELVVDAWAGVADPATGCPVTGDTLFAVYSAAKPIVSTCVHILAERGLVDYDAPIARYWPAFGATGKERATVRHALTHRAGVPHMPRGTSAETMCDWEAMCAGVAALAPWWEPGTRMGYHALTFGWILGEVVRRVDGRHFGQFAREEVSQPLAIGRELYFGVPDAEQPRVATADLGPTPTPAPTPDDLTERAMPTPLRHTLNRPDVRRACIPALNGLMTARALARFYAALIGQGVDGARLLTAERLAEVTSPLPRETDAVFGIAAAQGLGFFLGEELAGGRSSNFGHGGIGGSWGFADPEYGLAVGIAMTWGPESRGPALGAIAQRVRAVFGVPEQTPA